MFKIPVESNIRFASYGRRQLNAFPTLKHTFYKMSYFDVNIHILIESLTCYASKNMLVMIPKHAISIFIDHPDQDITAIDISEIECTTRNTHFCVSRHSSAQLIAPHGPDCAADRVLACVRVQCVVVRSCGFAYGAKWLASAQQQNIPSGTFNF